MKVDFIRDVAVRCTNMLTAAGYSFRPNDDRDAIRTYASIRHRRIRPRQRAVHRAQYAVPPHLTAGEQQLLAKVRAGDDLWPHQSRKIGNVAAEDGMLNDYGIQHFHLGTMPDPKRPNLIQGTNELLFAVVMEDDFYVLGIFNHSAWSKQQLLEIIQSNWPQLIAPYALKRAIGVRHNYTDEQAAKLRAAGINVVRQLADGTVHMGSGGGVTTNARSLAATMDAIDLIRFVEKLQRDVTTKLQHQVSSGALSSEAVVRLEWRGDTPVAVADPTGDEIYLTGQLDIPPL